MSITRINTNYEAIFARAQLQLLDSISARAMSHIASGKRIVNAGDDPASIGALSSAIADMQGNHTVQQGIQSGYELLEFADSVLSMIEDVLIEMNAIAVKLGNDATLSTTQTTALVTEFNALANTIDAASLNTLEWNGLQVANTQLNNKNIVIDATGTRTTLTGAAYSTAWNVTTLSVATTIAVTTAAARITQIDADLNTIGGYRGTLGSVMSALDLYLDTAIDMEMAYASTVGNLMDADIAYEVSKLSSAQIIAEAASSMLSQSFLQNSTVIGLLEDLT